MPSSLPAVSWGSLSMSLLLAASSSCAFGDTTYLPTAKGRSLPKSQLGKKFQNSAKKPLKISSKPVSKQLQNSTEKHEPKSYPVTWITSVKHALTSRNAKGLLVLYCFTVLAVCIPYFGNPSQKEESFGNAASAGTISGTFLFHVWPSVLGVHSHVPRELQSLKGRLGEEGERKGAEKRPHDFHVADIPEPETSASCKFSEEAEDVEDIHEHNFDCDHPPEVTFLPDSSKPALPKHHHDDTSPISSSKGSSTFLQLSWPKQFMSLRMWNLFFVLCGFFMLQHSGHDHSLCTGGGPKLISTTDLLGWMFSKLVKNTNYSTPGELKSKDSEEKDLSSDGQSLWDLAEIKNFFSFGYFCDCFTEGVMFMAERSDREFVVFLASLGSHKVIESVLVIGRKLSRMRRGVTGKAYKITLLDHLGYAMLYAALVPTGYFFSYLVYYGVPKFAWLFQSCFTGLTGAFFIWTIKTELLPDVLKFVLRKPDDWPKDVKKKKHGKKKKRGGCGHSHGEDRSCHSHGEDHSCHSHEEEDEHKRNVGHVVIASFPLRVRFGILSTLFFSLG